MTRCGPRNIFYSVKIRLTKLSYHDKHVYDDVKIILQNLRLNQLKITISQLQYRKWARDGPEWTTTIK